MSSWAPSAKNIAIHFIIECELMMSIASGHSKQFIELIDSYIVLPALTKVCDIASEAIDKLNMAKDSSLHDCHSCACYILMRHWKPLNVEYICDVTNTTLSELVGDFPNFVTLKVRFFSVCCNTASSLKSLSLCDSRDRLLMLLSQAESLVRNGDLLKYNESGALDEDTYQKEESANDTCHQSVAFSTCQEAINLSLRKYHSVTPQRNVNQLSNRNQGYCPPSSEIVNSYPSRMHLSTSSKMDSIVKNLYNQRQWDIQSQACKDDLNTMPIHSSLKKSTRERVTFDPATELPILLRMFEKTRHPTREQIEQLLCELSQFRKDKKPLEFFNIQYWFKNARAMCKRTNPDNLVLENNPERYSDSNGNDVSPFLQNGCNLVNIAEQHINENQNGNTYEEPQNLSYSNNYSNVIKTEIVESASSIVPYRIAEQNNNCEEAFPNDSAISSTDQQCNYEPPINKCCYNDSSNTIHILNREDNFRHLDSTNGKFRRNRVFIDPTTEIPILERWFSIETHPTSALINTICEEINNGAYRQQYQKLRPRNIQLWFKNHRAKLKRVSATSSKGSIEDNRLVVSPLSASTINSAESGVIQHDVSSHVNQFGGQSIECISVEKTETTTTEC
ncbi:hypothetical protein GJ496_006245 [Pomphorhynchus laevis]|nr:hypothetical protein GJ496_006245 [Pomphorhynchus laevis]